jgi:GT2 family glycosyltransferase
MGGVNSPRAWHQLVAIGITTKDRWDDLAVTLRNLRQQGLDQLETLVIDDGSTTALPDFFRQEFDWVEFERVETSLGYIFERNKIIRRLKAPFYLSLDDDSFPATGSLEEAALWMNERPHVAVLEFPTICHQNPILFNLPSKPYLSSHFVGCGFLLRRGIALKLGGFEEHLIFYGEETEYSLRCIGAGYEIYCFPHLQVRHPMSNSSRNISRRLYFGARAHILILLWYYPPLIASVRMIKYVPGFLVKARWARPYWYSLIAGCLAGLIAFLRLSKKATRLSKEQFCEWEKRSSNLAVS